MLVVKPIFLKSLKGAVNLKRKKNTGPNSGCDLFSLTFCVGFGRHGGPIRTSQVMFKQKGFKWPDSGLHMEKLNTFRSRRYFGNIKIKFWSSCRMSEQLPPKRRMSSRWGRPLEVLLSSRMGGWGLQPGNRTRLYGQEGQRWRWKVTFIMLSLIYISRLRINSEGLSSICF